MKQFCRHPRRALTHRHSAAIHGTAATGTDRCRGQGRRFPILGDVRGLGLMIGIEMVRDQATKECAQELRNRLVELCFERGVRSAAGDHERLADFAVDTIEQCLRMIE